MRPYGNIDSKFRFVILAAKRAKQLLGGAKPKVKSKSKNPIRIAQEEMRKGLIDYEIIEPKKAEVLKSKEESFMEEEIEEEAVDTSEKKKKTQRKNLKKKPAEKKPSKQNLKKKEKAKKTKV